MMNQYIKIGFVSVAMVLSCQLSADDLDDGIAYEDGLEDELRLDVNRSFIKQSAIGASGTGIKGSKTIVMGSSETTGAGNINIGTGADLSGATIINLSTVEDTNVIGR